MRPLGLVSNIFPGTCKLSISKCNHVNFLQNDNPNLLYSGIRGIALVLPADKIQPLSDFKIPINTVNDHELSVDECCDNISHQSCEKEIKEALVWDILVNLCCIVTVYFRQYAICFLMKAFFQFVYFWYRFN